MTHDSEPWLTTDERIPYVVLSGSISGDVKICNVIDALSHRWGRVYNVYNATAFALDEHCNYVFCVKAAGQCALISIMENTLQCTEEIDLESKFASPLFDHIKSVKEHVLSQHPNANIIIDAFGIEVSRKGQC